MRLGDGAVGLRLGLGHGVVGVWVHEETRVCVLTFGQANMTAEDLKRMYSRIGMTNRGV